MWRYLHRWHTHQTLKKIMDGHFYNVLCLLKIGIKSDPFSDHYGKQFKSTMSYDRVNNSMKKKVFWMTRLDWVDELTQLWLVPAQDAHLFYTRSHLSALQKCALLSSTNLQFIFIFKNAWHNLVIELCRAPFFKNIVQLFIKFTHSFVDIELLNFYKNAKPFYCLRELSLFWLNK